MTEEILVTVQSLWYWLLSQLGWEGIQLGWLPITLLVLACIGALVILRNLLGGHSGGGGSGGGSYSPYAPLPNQKGFPTRVYTGDPRLGSFSVPPKVYNFKVPTPTPDLTRLTKPLNLDLEKASKMYLTGNPEANRSEAMARTFQFLYGKREPEPEPKPVGAPKEEEQQRASNSGVTSQAVTSSPLNWDLAMKLFVPRFGRKK